MITNEVPKGNNSGSKGYHNEKQEGEEVLTATKQFNSAAALSSFLHSPMTPKLYRILNVDWTKNKVKVECFPFQMEEAVQ